MLTRLQLLHYRNHQSAGYSFDNQTVLINGPNGSGKTNLLDAIYFCCMCRSYFLRQDQLLVQHGLDFFRLDASFDNQGQTDEVSVKVVSGRKKEVLLNGVAYEKLADHIGQFPVIMITPDDTRLIQQYADERRRFLDLTISQVDREYLFDLQQYQKVLAQRNALLKQAWQRGADKEVLDSLDKQLWPAAGRIWQARRNFTERIVPGIQAIYARLSGNREVPGIDYQSDLNHADAAELHARTRQEDLAAGRTQAGVHRDDLLFTLDGEPLKQVASQGQIKSLLIALKLAAFHGDPDGRKPLLLLDDIFEKLDRKRMEALFSVISEGSWGGMFLTDADSSRSQDILRNQQVLFDRVVTNNPD